MYQFLKGGGELEKRMKENDFEGFLRWLKKVKNSPYK